MKNGKEAIVATLCEQEEKLIKRAGMSRTMRGFCRAEFAQAAGCRGNTPVIRVSKGKFAEVTECLINCPGL